MINFQAIKCRLGLHGDKDVTGQSGCTVSLSHDVRERVINASTKTKIKEVVITAQHINCHLTTKTCKHCGAVDKIMVKIPGKQSSITVSMEAWERHPDEGMFFWSTYDDPFALSPLGRRLSKK